jgi:uptake hydrogenase small subunit
MSFLNAEEPSVCDFVTDFDINVLWHPSLGMEPGDDLKAILNGLVAGATPLDILVFEGTVIQAPNGTGEWNRFAGPSSRFQSKRIGITAYGGCEHRHG